MNGNEPVNPYFFHKCRVPKADGNYTFGDANTLWSQCDQSILFNDLKPDFDNNPYKARFYGFLFNTFVMLQIFNEINARKLLKHEINPF
jgi:hypothetical protein